MIYNIKISVKCFESTFNFQLLTFNFAPYLKQNLRKITNIIFRKTIAFLTLDSYLFFMINIFYFFHPKRFQKFNIFQIFITHPIHLVFIISPQDLLVRLAQQYR